VCVYRFKANDKKVTQIINYNSNDNQKCEKCFVEKCTIK